MFQSCLIAIVNSWARVAGYHVSSSSSCGIGTRRCSSRSRRRYRLLGVSSGVGCWGWDRAQMSAGGISVCWSLSLLWSIRVLTNCVETTVFSPREETTSMGSCLLAPSAAVAGGMVDASCRAIVGIRGRQVRESTTWSNSTMPPTAKGVQIIREPPDCRVGGWRCDYRVECARPVPSSLYRDPRTPHRSPFVCVIDAHAAPGILAGPRPERSAPALT